MALQNPARTAPLSTNSANNRRAGLLGLAVVAVAGLMLSGCNTTAGAGKDVAATGTAITRGANDVKSGL